METKVDCYFASVSVFFRAEMLLQISECIAFLLRLAIKARAKPARAMISTGRIAELRRLFLIASANSTCCSPPPPYTQCSPPSGPIYKISYDNLTIILR